MKYDSLFDLQKRVREHLSSTPIPTQDQIRTLIQKGLPMPDLSSLLRPSVSQTLPPVAIPEEIYPGVIMGHELNQSSNGTPLLRFNIQLIDWSSRVPPEARLQDGPNGQKVPIDITRRTLRKDFFLTPAAYFRLEKFLVDMGEVIETDAEGNKDYETPVAQLKGAKVALQVQRIVSRTTQEFINVAGEIAPWKD